MKERFLGKTGIKVSEVAFGTLTFGIDRGWMKNFGAVNQKEADILVNMSLEAGVNFFDTADRYSYGLSEEILGKALTEESEKKKRGRHKRDDKWKRVVASATP